MTFLLIFAAVVALVLAAAGYYEWTARRGARTLATQGQTDWEPAEV